MLIVLPVSSTWARAREDRGVIADWLRDGTALLTVAALGLLAAGLFAWFLAVTDQLLPHDLAWLSITEVELRAVADGRLVHFMAHDRAAFGGTLIAIAVLDLWLIRVPLAAGHAWAWWTLTIAGGVGFLSFLTYLGTGYLDTWHGLATLVLLPLYGLGLAGTRRTLIPPTGLGALAPPGDAPERISRRWIGRALLLLVGFGIAVAGLTIATIGTLVVFVPQDIEYIGLTRAGLDAIDPRLVPLIAHDRSGFGGGLATTGLTVLACAWCGRPSRSLWESLAIAGTAGFGAAVGIHGLVGYTDVTHVGPAVVGAALFAAGLALRGRDGRGRTAQVVRRGTTTSPTNPARVAPARIGIAALAARGGSTSSKNGTGSPHWAWSGPAGQLPRPMASPPPSSARNPTLAASARSRRPVRTHAQIHARLASPATDQTVWTTRKALARRPSVDQLTAGA